MHPTSPPSPETVEQWLREEAAGLRALARGLLRDENDAEDAVQDAWVASLRGRPERPGPWLRTVVRRLAFRRSRTASRRRRREGAAARPAGLSSTAEVAEGLDLRRRVVEAVAALEEPYRSTVVLRYFHDRSPAEVAEVQAVPEATVKTRLHRALVRMRAALDGEHGGRRAEWRASLAALVDVPWGGGTAAGPALAAGGTVIAVKKLVALALLVVLLGVGGFAVWRYAIDRAGEPAAPPEATVVAQAPPPLAGRPAPPAPAPAEDDAWVLRADPVPDATFAGRVVDEAGAGVAGARVRLHWYAQKPSFEPIMAYGTNPLYRREKERLEAPAFATNRDGYFRLDRPYASISYVGVDAEGYPPAVVQSPSGSFLTVVLKHEVLVVRVTTGSGQVVPRAEVRLVTRWDLVGMPGPYARQVLATATTGGDGRAELPVGSRGQFALEVLPAEPTLGIVQIGSIEDGPREIEVRVPSARTSARRVVDADTGLPVPDAYADVLHEFPGFSTYTTDLFRRRVHADGEGRLEIPIQEGTSTLVSAPGYETESLWHDDPVRIARAMRIEGTLRSADGLPVADAGLFLVIPGGLPHDTAYIGASPVAAFTDADGRYELEVKQAWSRHGYRPPDRGFRTLVAAHPDHPTVAVEEAVPVVPRSVRRIDLRFPRPATVDVLVVDGGGKPLPGKSVGSRRLLPWPATWPPGREPNGFYANGLVRWAPIVPTTDAEGRARLEGLTTGTHSVRAENASVQVDLLEGETKEVRIVLGVGAFISGRLVDAEGRPVPRTTVLFGGPARAGSTQTDADGRFRFDDLTEGEYSVYLSGLPTLGPRRQISTLARPGDVVTLRIPAGLARLRLHLEGVPEGTAEFQLTTATGGWLSNQDEATRSRTSFIAIPSSPFETDEFVPGPGAVIVRAKDLGSRVVPFDAPELRTTDVHVRFEAPGEVAGRVTVPKSAKWEIVLLRAVPTGTDSQRDAWTHNTTSVSGKIADDRTFRIPAVQPGRWQVRFLARDEGPWTEGTPAVLEVRSGETTEVELAP